MLIGWSVLVTYSLANISEGLRQEIVQTRITYQEIGPICAQRRLSRFDSKPISFHTKMSNLRLPLEPIDLDTAYDDKTARKHNRKKNQKTIGRALNHGN